MTQVHLDRLAWQPLRDALHNLKHSPGLEDRFEHVSANRHPERLDLFEDHCCRIDAQNVKVTPEPGIRLNPLGQDPLAIQQHDERALRRSWVDSNHDHLGIAFR